MRHPGDGWASIARHGELDAEDTPGAFCSAALERMRAPMEEGTVDFSWLVSALKKQDYTGAPPIEHLDGAEPDAVKLRDRLLELGVSP